MLSFRICIGHNPINVDTSFFVINVFLANMYEDMVDLGETFNRLLTTLEVVNPPDSCVLHVPFRYRLQCHSASR